MKETPTIEQGLGTLMVMGSSGRNANAFIDRVGDTGPMALLDYSDPLAAKPSLHD
jgi:hypothetical protein